jgi:hypothetical protein
MDTPYEYNIHDHINFIIEEVGNQFTAFRKLSWGDSTPHYELRRWRNTADGGEMAAKGCTFLTEEGPSELANVLVRLGFGDTRELLTIMSEREDFRKSLNSVLGKDDPDYDESAGTLDDDYFDPKALLGG